MNNQAGGIQTYQAGAGTNYGAVIIGADHRLYLATRVSGADGSWGIVGGTTTQPALEVYAMAGQTGKLASFGVVGVSKASIDTLGYYYVGADNVIGPRGAAIANPTDPATTMAAVVAILARIRASSGHGLIAG
jgi:hypothetical protein